ncbi:MAG: hypothetical protein AB7N71_03420, partial [Phycisphaerae bacterium]
MTTKSAEFAAFSAHETRSKQIDPADLLTIGFGTSVAMWAVGYFGRLPIGDGVMLPNAAILSALAACMILAGWAAAVTIARPLQRLWTAGLITGGLNLLVLGSVIGRDTPQEMMRVAVLWVPSLVLVTVLLMYAGAAARLAILPSAERNSRERDWRAAFALTCVAATTVMLALGGAVTGFEAGLAVVDWPNSF